MFVSDIMTCFPRTISPNAKLKEAASIMCLHRIHALPVVAEDGTLVGNISEMDLLKNLLPTLDDIISGNALLEIDRMASNYSTAMEQRVYEIMSAKPISVSPEQHILKATATMTSHRFRRIPVTDNANILVGVMSLGDVHKAIFQTLFSDS